MSVLVEVTVRNRKNWANRQKPLPAGETGSLTRRYEILQIILTPVEMDDLINDVRPLLLEPKEEKNRARAIVGLSDGTRRPVSDGMRYTPKLSKCSRHKR